MWTCHSSDYCPACLPPSLALDTRVLCAAHPLALTDHSGSVPDIPNIRRRASRAPLLWFVPSGLIVCAGRIHGKTCQRLSSSNPGPGSILLHMRHAQSTVGLNLWTSCIIFGNRGARWLSTLAGEGRPRNTIQLEFTSSQHRETSGCCQGQPICHRDQSSGQLGTREKAAVQTAPVPGQESTIRSTCRREPSDLQHFRH